MTIEEMNLRGFALKGAQTLQQAFPEVVFNSGRRDKTQQARAMVLAIAQSGNREWIYHTYKWTYASSRCQLWVSNNPNAQTIEDLFAGLLSVIEGLTDEELAELSKHLSGDAWDARPMPDRTDIIAAIQGLEGLDIFLTHEGGLERWHAQFKEQA